MTKAPTLLEIMDLSHLREDYEEFRRDEVSPLAAVWAMVRMTWDIWREDSAGGARYRQLRYPPKLMYWHPHIDLKLSRWNPLFWLVLLFGPTD